MVRRFFNGGFFLITILAWMTIYVDSVSIPINNLLCVIGDYCPPSSSMKVNKSDIWGLCPEVGDVAPSLCWPKRRIRYKILNKYEAIAEQLTYKNTTYYIRDEFDLKGKSVAIPAGCTLVFDGGCFKNGVLSNGENVNLIGGLFFGVSIYTSNSLGVYNCIFRGNEENVRFISITGARIIISDSSFMGCGNNEISGVVGVLLNGDCSGSIIRNCRFEGIIASKGSSGVGISIYDGKLSKGVTIQDCSFINISAIDDGDGIVIWGSPNGYDYKIDSKIVGCYFENCSKRAIKIQTRGVKVVNNKVFGGCSEAAVDFQMGECYIDSLYLKECYSYSPINIENNEVDSYIRNVVLENEKKPSTTMKFIQLGNSYISSKKNKGRVEICNICCPHLGESKGLTSSTSFLFIIPSPKLSDYGDIILRDITIEGNKQSSIYLINAYGSRINRLELYNIISPRGVSFKAGDGIITTGLVLDNLKGITIGSLSKYRDLPELSVDYEVPGMKVIIQGKRAYYYSSTDYANQSFLRGSRKGDVFLYNDIYYKCVEDGSNTSPGTWENVPINETGIQ